MSPTSIKIESLNKFWKAVGFLLFSSFPFEGLLGGWDKLASVLLFICEARNLFLYHVCV